METITVFFEDETGASAVEYGLLVALIAVVIIASVSLLGQTISNMFTSVSGAVSTAS